MVAPQSTNLEKHVDWSSTRFSYWIDFNITITPASFPLNTASAKDLWILWQGVSSCLFWANVSVRLDAEALAPAPGATLGVYWELLCPASQGLEWAPSWGLSLPLTPLQCGPCLPHSLFSLSWSLQFSVGAGDKPWSLALSAVALILRLCYFLFLPKSSSPGAGPGLQDALATGTWACRDPGNQDYSILWPEAQTHILAHTQTYVYNFLKHRYRFIAVLYPTLHYKHFFLSLIV